MSLGAKDVSFMHSIKGTAYPLINRLCSTTYSNP